MRNLLVVVVATLCLSSASLAATLEEDVQRYLRVFEGDQSLHADAAASLAWMGLSDPRLFDLLERRVLEEYPAGNSDRLQRERVARYMRALGCSGQPKYAGTLSMLLQEPMYRRYASDALADLERYERWNPLISDRGSFRPEYSDETNRLLNMLRSDELILLRIAAKRIYFAQDFEPAVLDRLAQRLRAVVSQAGNSRENDDAVAWMVKALGSSKDGRFRPLLEEVIDVSRSGTATHSHATRVLQRLPVR
jgi:hypothetical protein